MEEPKITSTNTEKVKDSRRVEQGKRLGAISKEAKAREQQRESLMSSCVVFGLPAVIGIAAAAVVCYYYYGGGHKRGTKGRTV